MKRFFRFGQNVRKFATYNLDSNVYKSSIVSNSRVFPTSGHIDFQHFICAIAPYFNQKTKESMRPGDIPYNFIKLRYNQCNDRDFIQSASNAAIKDKDTIVGSLTHSTTEENVRLILQDGVLKPGNSAPGCASQAGVCVSSDCRAQSLVQATNGELAHPMLFFNADNDVLSPVPGQCGHSDGNTYKPKTNESELPIEVYATYTQEEGLKVIDANAFVKYGLSTLMFSIEQDKKSLLNLFTVLNENTVLELIDKNGNVYDHEKLEELPSQKLLEIFESTMEEPITNYPKKDKWVWMNQMKIQEDYMVKKLSAFQKLINDPKIREALGQYPELKKIADNMTRVVSVSNRNPNFST